MVPLQSGQTQGATSADVCEAVVRFQIESWELDANPYCVLGKGKNAVEQFLGRFNPLPTIAASSPHC